MLIAAIILGLVALISGIVGLARYSRNEYDGFWGFCLFVVFGVLWLIAFLGALNLHIGSQELTGYIYSSSNKTGYTTAHIRFSQNAGTDAQPEFCVKTNSDAGRAVAKYVGSNTKVDVNEPSYFYFSNNPFACGTTKTTITEAK